MAHSQRLTLLLEVGVFIHEADRLILACCDNAAETSQLLLSIKPKQNQLLVNLHLLAAGTERL